MDATVRCDLLLDDSQTYCFGKTFKDSNKPIRETSMGLGCWHKQIAGDVRVLLDGAGREQSSTLVRLSD